MESVGGRKWRQAGLGGGVSKVNQWSTPLRPPLLDGEELCARGRKTALIPVSIPLPSTLSEVEVTGKLHQLLQMLPRSEGEGADRAAQGKGVRSRNLCASWSTEAGLGSCMAAVECTDLNLSQSLLGSR